MFLEARFNGTQHSVDGFQAVTPFRLSKCSYAIGNWTSIVDRLPDGWDDGLYHIEGFPYPWCETLSDDCDCHGMKGRLDETYCSDFGLHIEMDKRTRKSENVRYGHYIRRMEETIAHRDESRRRERPKGTRRLESERAVLVPAKLGEGGDDHRPVTVLPPDAINRIHRLVGRGFYCSIHGRHHPYGGQAIRQTMASLTGACAQILTWAEAERTFAMSRIGDISSHWLRMHQSDECAERLVWGDADTPPILYKYIPKKLIGKGAPNSLRATQLLALNDDMECNVITMKSRREDDTLDFLTTVQSSMKEHLGIAVPWEKLLKRSLRYGDLRLSTFIQQYLNPLVGVVSFSTDILVPTMWAHYAQNTGIVVGYDTEALRTLGFELRPVIYSELAPKYYPEKGNAIRLDFVDREHIERELRDGRKREGFPILASTNLAEFGADWKSLCRLLLVKGMPWAYEKEVRLLVDLDQAHDVSKEDENGERIKVIEPPPESIKEVYGGANTRSADVERAVQIARGGNKKGLFVGNVSSHAFRIQKTGGSRY